MELLQQKELREKEFQQKKEFGEKKIQAREKTESRNLIATLQHEIIWNELASKQERVEIRKPEFALLKNRCMGNFSWTDWTLCMNIFFMKQQ